MEVFGAAFAEKFLADGLSLRRRVCGAIFFSFHLSEVQHAGYTELALPCFSRSSSAGCLILQDCGVAPVSCLACWESRPGGGATID